MRPAGMVEARPEPPGDEVWLRGNVRPVAAVTIACVAGLVVVVAIVAAIVAAGGLQPLGPPLAKGAAVGAAAMLLALAALAASAAGPRLVRRGDRLVVRLAPTAVAEVPLDAVECFFQGSTPLDPQGRPTCGDHAVRRVNTLVMRLAERATEQRTRRTFTPWGTWDDGYVVFDGRWCEPLSADLARTLSRRLLDAKREAATAQGDPP